jgi:membrane-anchored protein YejM (alkaline phosphatase superfamily)
MFLILFLNILIFIDSYIFTQYRFHLNSFIFKIIKDPDVLMRTDFSPVKLVVMVFITFSMAVLFWSRGEKWWRSMQARFSNPVSNWYLVLITLCFFGAQGIQYKSESNGKVAITQIAQLFPLSISLAKANGSQTFKQDPRGYKDFYFPEDINCPSKNNKNVVLITFSDWSNKDLTEELTPNIFHYRSHGISFKNHFSGGKNQNDGFFSLLYSMTPNYSSSVKNQKVLPIFMSELSEANFDFSFYKRGVESPVSQFLPSEKEISSDYIESNLADKSERNLVGPFFMQVFLGIGDLTFKDAQVKVILESLIKSKLISETIVIITGAYSQSGNTPLLIIWPGRKAAEVTKATTHYDVLPTIMQEDWKCKTPMNKYSFGVNLFSTDERTSIIQGNYQHLELLNLKNQTNSVIDPLYGFVVKEVGTQNEVASDEAEFVLSSLKEMAKFYRR